MNVLLVHVLHVRIYDYMDKYKCVACVCMPAYVYWYVLVQLMLSSYVRVCMCIIVHVCVHQWVFSLERLCQIHVGGKAWERERKKQRGVRGERGRERDGQRRHRLAVWWSFQLSKQKHPETPQTWELKKCEGLARRSDSSAYLIQFYKL